MSIADTALILYVVCSISIFNGTAGDCVYELLFLAAAGVVTFSVVVGVAYILKRSADSKKKREIITASKKPIKRFDIDYDKLRENSSLRGSNRFYSSDSSRRGGLSAITHMAETVDEEKGDVN